MPVSLVDGRNEPLSRKLLARPGALRRIRRPDRRARGRHDPPVLHDRRRGRARGGARSSRSTAATRRSTGSARRPGSRRVFADEDVPHPVGLDVARQPTISPARSTELRARSPAARGAVLKLDQGVSGLGNALLDLDARRPRPSRRDRARGRGDRASSSTSRALDDAGRDRRGADRGRGLPEPERAAPDEPRGTGRHHVDARSGARRARTARPTSAATSPPIQEYAAQIAAEALKVGRRLAREGVIGRAAVDFAAVQRRGRLAVRTRSRSTSAAAARPIRCSRSRA